MKMITLSMDKRVCLQIVDVQIHEIIFTKSSIHNIYINTSYSSYFGITVVRELSLRVVLTKCLIFGLNQRYLVILDLLKWLQYMT